jgi:hypothetical protein
MLGVNDKAEGGEGERVSWCGGHGREAVSGSKTLCRSAPRTDPVFRTIAPSNCIYPPESDRDL